jgi:hypothetical protein
MSEAVATITAVTIDANDAAVVAAFWAELTGTSVTDVVGEGRLHFLSAAEGAPELCIQRVSEPKTVKARVHLDLSLPRTWMPSRSGSSPWAGAGRARSRRWTSTRGARTKTRRHRVRCARGLSTPPSPATARLCSADPECPRHDESSELTLSIRKRAP